MKLMDAKQEMHSEGGFTLVELAVVMIIIGLLIGGVLQGQQLIENARVTNFVSTIKAYEVAMPTFLDSYNSLPGDITAPATRLANCGTLCGNAGNGDGVLNITPGQSPVAVTEVEGATFFVHLAAAELISGVDSNVATRSTIPGQSYPEVPFGGGLQVGYTDGVATDFVAATVADDLIDNVSGTEIDPSRGVYLVLTDDLNQAATPGLTAALHRHPVSH